MRVPIATLVLLGAFAPPCTAARDVQLSVSAGFDGHIKDGRWFPVTVVIRNAGMNIQGILQVRTEGLGRVTDFVLPVKVPSNSNRAYSLCALGEGLKASRLKVVLRGRGFRPVEAEAQTRPHPSTDRILVLVTRQASGVAAVAGMKVPPSGAERFIGMPAPSGPTSPWNPPSAIPGTGLPFDTANVSLAHINTSRYGTGAGAGLPTHPRAYDTVDAVLLYDAAPAQFSDEEVYALENWVASGGTLVVSVGAQVDDIRGTFVEDLIPVTLTGATTVTAMRQLEQHYNAPMSVTEPFLVATATVKHGNVLASEAGVPLIVEGRYDMGRVIYLAFDIKKQPIRSWTSGMRQFWREVLTEPRPAATEAADEWALPAGGVAGPYYPYGRGQTLSLSDAVAQIPQMDVPSFGIVGVFLFLYVVCLVPVNYWVLKTLDRRELSWVTTPAIVLVFSLSAYAVGRSVKGGRLLINHLGIAQTTAGARTAWLNSFYGIFSPSKTRYDVTFKDPGAVVVESVPDVNPSNPRRLTVTEGDRFALRSMNVDMWSMRIFHSQSSLRLGDGVRATAVVSRDGEVFGAVTNLTSHTLRGCVAIHKGKRTVVGDIAPGATAEFSLRGARSEPAQLLIQGIPPHAPSSLRSVGNAGANALLGPGRLQRTTPADHVLLVAWAEGAAAGRMDISPGRAKTASATILAVRVPIRAARGPFRISGKMCALSVREIHVEQAGGLRPDGTIAEATGYWVADLRLPVSGWDVRFDQVTLVFTFTQGAVNLAVWDWQGRGWYPLAPRRGSNLFRLPDADRFVRRPEATVRVKIENLSPRQPIHVTELDLRASGVAG